MNEIIFLIEESLEGGYEARALGYSIFTQAESIEDLHEKVRDAIQCHFENGDTPSIIRLHYVKEEILSYEVT
ncbi:MAG: 2-oxoisovalerate dehydrogenase [Saprospiraceae bacterium]|nr:2-oxoisovalerate dehydrogenase [Saprospiraceae bacterium]